MRPAFRLLIELPADLIAENEDSGRIMNLIQAQTNLKIRSES